MTTPKKLSAERLAEIAAWLEPSDKDHEHDFEERAESCVRDLLVSHAALEDELAAAEAREAKLREALEPFAAACAKADQSSEDIRRHGMGHGHSDDASPGWGIRYKHLKAARAALAPEGKEGGA